MIALDGVPSAAVPALWPRVRPWIERALAESGGHFRSDDVREALERRDMQLWAVRRGDEIAGALVTELVDYPRRRVCRLALAAAAVGIRDGWLPQLSIVEEWARANRCDLVEIYGRPGWARLIAHQRKRVVLERRLRKNPNDPEFQKETGS